MKDKEAVDHPQHYGGKDNPHETIKCIEAWGLGYTLGNAVKYISRHRKKMNPEEDLFKAVWYVMHELKVQMVENEVQDKVLKDRLHYIVDHL